MNPSDLKYSRSHEWIAADGAVRRLGISQFAQEQLGDIVYVELPEVGRELAAGEECMVIESCKATSGIYAPVAGRVSAVNEDLAEHPEQINQDPYGEGWLIEIEVSGEAEELMDAESYRQFCEESH